MQALERADRRERVKPAPDPAGPEQHAVVGSDPRPYTLHHGRVSPRGFLRKPKRHHVDELPEGRIGAIAVTVHEPGEPHAPKPQVALLLARADHEVGHRALSEHRAPGASRRVVAVRRARGLEHLDHLRVVEVRDKADRQARRVSQQLRREALSHHDVMGAHRPEQPVEVEEPGFEQLAGHQRGIARRGRGQR